VFTGIVQRMGRVAELDLSAEWGRVGVDAGAWDRPIEIGESVAVCGTCLTVKESGGGILRFDVLRETFRRTNLGEKAIGSMVNLERALRWGDPLGGHIMIGHVDGIARVRAVQPVGRDWRFEFECSKELMDGMVFKGSVSVDGVSLTIADMSADSIGIHIIPHTYEITCFGQYRPGDAVNIEVDILGKFVRRYVERGVAFPGLTWDALRRTGLIADATTPAAG
jgi:riboflavin synthase